MTLLEPLPATVAGLTPDEDDAFRRLTAKIIRHRTRNRIRTVYYNGRNELHDLGYSSHRSPKTSKSSSDGRKRPSRDSPTASCSTASPPRTAAT